MEDVLAIVVTALLVSFAVRWAAVKLRLPMPTRAAVITVFVLVILTLYGNYLAGG